MKCYSFIYVHTYLNYKHIHKVHCDCIEARRHLLLLFVCEMLHKNAIIKCNKIKFRTQFIFFSFVFAPLSVYPLVWRTVSSTLPPPFDTLPCSIAIIHNRLYSRAIPFFSLFLFDFVSCATVFFSLYIQFLVGFKAQEFSIYWKILLPIFVCFECSCWYILIRTFELHTHDNPSIMSFSTNSHLMYLLSLFFPFSSDLALSLFFAHLNKTTWAFKMHEKHSLSQT